MAKRHPDYEDARKCPRTIYQNKVSVNDSVKEDRYQVGDCFPHIHDGIQYTMEVLDVLSNGKYTVRIKPGSERVDKENVEKK